PWTPEEERLLGKYTDREVARLLVRDVRAVAKRRRVLGRPACHGSYKLWADYEIELLGTAPDREVAKKLKRSLASVQCARARFQVSQRFSGQRIHCDAVHTSQICTPCLSDTSTSGRAGWNSCATCPLKPVSTMAFITA